MYRALVAEVDGHAIGLMSVSSEIEVGLLQQCFDLRPYNDLTRIDEAAIPDQVLADEDVSIHAVEGVSLVTGEGLDEIPPTQEVGDGTESVVLEGEAKLGAEDEVHVDSEATAEVEVAAADPEMSAEQQEPKAYERPPQLCNAFCISVFCMDESFESRSPDFLHAAFALYPDREYAIITLPHITSEFGLLNCFSQVEPVPSSSFGHLLYVFHRDALGGAASLSIREADVADSKALVPLLPKGSAEVFSLAVAPSGPNQHRRYTAFVAECAGHPVSLSILDHECPVQTLQSQYGLEDFILFTEHAPEHHTMLHSFVVNPIFSRQSRFILKEIFRQSHCSCMYFKLQPHSMIPAVLNEFVQVKPRRRPITSPALDEELAEQREQFGQPPRDVHPAESPLYFLSRKLISEPKIVSNTRIVVIGCSDAAIAFLEALVTVPYLNFNYLYVVVPRAHERLCWPRGTSVGGDSIGVAPFFARNCSYTSGEMRALSLGTRVRLVDSRVVDIDRQAKSVTLPDDSILPYDYLVIAPDFADQSLQYIPEAVGVSGAFSLIDEEAEAAASAYLRSVQHLSVSVLVYGASLDAYCIVQGLLSRGIPPSAITMVQPPRASGAADDCFFDPRVAERVHGTLEKVGIEVRLFPIACTCVPEAY